MVDVRIVGTLRLSSYPIFKATILPNVVALSGDVVWVNTTAAYAHLPEALKVLAESWSAVYSNNYDLS
jgi:taurine dioxygenase